ncbi:MAG TPA: heme exporter protein CcmB [Polyangiaceae bacterium LLY-WYZ-14_1]|jgi:heme exporter protein B|nr:heme exporter protein CcmB [Polyangiaceae bacterium LLY-WYZ-14_1]
MKGVITAARLVAAKDLRIELRTREITTTTTLFAVLVVVLSSLSFYLDQVIARRLAPGVLWVSVAFSGVLAVGRAWAREAEQDAFRALLLAPLPRAGIFLGKTAAVLSFLLVVEAVVVPIVALLFHVALPPVLGPLALLLFLGTLGFAAAGTLFGAMTVKTRARDLALSVVLFPLVAPCLLAGVVATRELFGGAPLSEVLAWARILLAADILFVTAGLVLFPTLAAD